MSGKEFADAFRKALVEVLVPEIKVMQGQLDRLEKRAEEHGRILQEHDRKLEILVDAVNGLKEGFHELKEGQNKLVEAVNGLKEGFRELREGFHELKGDFHELKDGQQRILDRPDLDKRMTHLETLVDKMRRSEGRAASAP